MKRLFFILVVVLYSSVCFGGVGDSVLDGKNFIYNVKNHGAVGDGLTDDTSAIQAAIDLAEAAGGGQIWFPVGEYLVTSLTVNGSYIVLQGESKGTILTKNTSTGDLLYLAPTGSDADVRIYEIGINDLWFEQNEKASGSNSSVTANKLVASGADFVTAGVAVGDLVTKVDYSSPYDKTALVTAVDSATTLSLDTNIFTSSPVTYKVATKPTADSLVHAVRVAGLSINRVRTSGGFRNFHFSGCGMVALRNVTSYPNYALDPSVWDDAAWSPVMPTESGMVLVDNETHESGEYRLPVNFYISDSEFHDVIDKNHATPRYNYCLKITSLDGGWITNSHFGHGLDSDFWFNATTNGTSLQSGITAVNVSNSYLDSTHGSHVRFAGGEASGTTYASFLFSNNHLHYISPTLNDGHAGNAMFNVTSNCYVHDVSINGNVILKFDEGYGVKINSTYARDISVVGNVFWNSTTINPESALYTTTTVDSFSFIGNLLQGSAFDSGSVNIGANSLNFIVFNNINTDNSSAYNYGGGHSNYIAQDKLTDWSLKTSGDIKLKPDGADVIIGDGAAGVDYELKFDGESNDGIIKWDEDNDWFAFMDDIFTAYYIRMQSGTPGFWLDESGVGNKGCYVVLDNKQLQFQRRAQDFGAYEAVPFKFYLDTGNAEFTGTVKASCGTLTCDYVFDDDYKLLPLTELKKHISSEKQLPGMTANRGMDSLDLGNATKELVVKTEEQALYILQLHERLEVLEAKLSNLSTDE